MAGGEPGKMQSTEDDYNIKADILYKFYFEFNNNYNINHNDFPIEDYFSNLLSTGSARDLFKKFIENIKFLSKKYSNKFNKIDKGEQIKKRCIYLKYWFYDEILKKKFNNSDIDKLNKDWESKKNLFSSNEYFSCEFYKLNLEQIKEIKKLYHFLIIYNIYKNNDIYPSAYCQYLKELSDIITKNTTSCESHSNDAYCNEYNTYIKPYINEDILPLPDDRCEKPISSQGVDGKTEKSESKSKNNETSANYIKFINFWFNRKLREIIKDENDRNSVYSHFNSLCSQVNGLKELNVKIKEIDEEQYKKWSILYDLYDNYNKIINAYIKNSDDLQSKSSQYAQKCVNTFKLGIDIYNQKDDDEFNKAMKEFSIFYSKIKHEIHEYKKIKLPELQKLTFTMDVEATVNNKIASFCKSGIVMENSSAQNIYKKFCEENIDESLCVKYCGDLISDNSDNNKDATICAKIVTNLKKLPNIKDVGDTHEDRCSNLTYWTYDILMKEFNTNKNVIVDNNIISKLNNAIFRVNRELKKDENCTYYIDGTFPEWTEEKNLHDYFENYSTFIKNITDNVKNETYCQYIDYISNLYKKYIKKCCSCYSRPKYVCEEHCPKFFKCNREFFPIHLLHKLEYIIDSYKIIHQTRLY
ncbi:hypothetical protein PVNG_02157 [Plasmodium vivax North Korean]|uniref:Uncharacterized protein n=1 Tax=Plasmodium vivax North Korean TaxID=1035514 RepID=A0A0J9TUN2_PLAVI|nr:hypothetical protein PVNG_02157 [Plasmodium vivax North Korean]